MLELHDACKKGSVAERIEFSLFFPPLFWYCQTLDQQKVQVLNGLNLVMFFLTISHLLVMMLLDMVS
jgi:hypothetical protein